MFMSSCTFFVFLSLIEYAFVNVMMGDIRWQNDHSKYADDHNYKNIPLPRYQGQDSRCLDIKNAILCLHKSLLCLVRFCPPQTLASSKRISAVWKIIRLDLQVVRTVTKLS